MFGGKGFAAMLTLTLTVFAVLAQPAADTGLLGHWPLAGTGRDCSPNKLHAVAHNVDFDAAGPDGVPNTAASFNGNSSWLEVPHTEALELGGRRFTICAWVRTDDQADTFGDLVTKYDPAVRRGFNLSIIDGQYRTSSMRRNVVFGIDNALVTPWDDCGNVAAPDKRCGVWGFCTHNGRLYAGSYIRNNGAYCPSLTPDGGHVYRYEGGREWTDLGRVGKSRNVLCMASYKGDLYAGVSFDDLGGEQPAGCVYRLDETTGDWVFCGQVGQSQRIECMAICNGHLYVGTIWSDPGTDGVYRYKGGQEWEWCDPNGANITSLGIYRGTLIRGRNDVYQLLPSGEWKYLGPPRGGDLPCQNWAFSMFRGRLTCSTYPAGEAYAFDEDNRSWQNLGCVSSSGLPYLEAMALVNYNGKLYSGVWPRAEIVRYEGEGQWARMGRIGRIGDGGGLAYHTVPSGVPNVSYFKCELDEEVLPAMPSCYAGRPGISRPSAMTIYGGRFYVGVWDWEYDLGGQVYSMEAGKCVSADRPLPGGWRHIAAVRADNKLRLYIDGKLESESIAFVSGHYDLTNDEPLKIGFGESDYFRGDMCDVRLYDRALSDDEVAGLASRPSREKEG